MANSRYDVSMKSANSPVSIGLIGDYSSEVKAHAAIPKALTLAASAVGMEVLTQWLPTSTLDDETEARLSGFDALWCVPGSPYASMEGALRAIQFAREKCVPFLGTCGGFQHAVIEYARNVLGWRGADHEESNPSSPIAFVKRMACSLSGVTGKIQILPGTSAIAIYGKPEIVEQFNCNFGVNPKYQAMLDDGKMKIAGVDNDGGVRIIELPRHRFFIATLFQPELLALSNLTHPLVAAFVRAAAAGK